MQNYCSKIFNWISEGNSEKLKEMDKRNLMRCLKDGRNPLHEACFQGEIEIVRYLLDLGFDPNEEDAEGNSPIHLAFCNGNVEVVKLLVNRGADPNKRDKQGFPLLHKAYYLEMDDLVKFLLDNGADPEVRDNFGLKYFEYGKNGRMRTLPERGTN
ncbi:putative ankyrin repeat protein [Metallosphaera sp. J1]|uniref:ankyrin repeat domain-containing protein n=1 Tax=Metallosphaera javensis (ex Hofmann et al. 2022) TaxID=99938 RepID=UPI001EDD8830|nr:ankyrin repeat domain-containing protein [Metallosphaera javensis (ex Hofmann et al. 2022)]MCG3110159.1 putative ankyrin repeat protein [Metallosphaera javensis (ex Hofmann et al. 2022)]